MKLLLLLVALLLPGLLTPLVAQPDLHPGAGATSLEFIENNGQWDAHARYAAALPSGRLFAEAAGLTFALLDAPGLAHHSHRPESNNPQNPPADGPLRGHTVALCFVKAAPTATLTATAATAEHRNYFLGADPSRWARDVRSFRQLHYAGLWPGIDARVYESADQQLEYDFVLAPGADATAIALRHEGAEALALDAAGSLRVKTSVGTITERAPQAWQLDATGRRRAVACRYQLAGNTVTFRLGAYDHARTLTIDPVVVFSTYSGSFADNWGFTATYDNAGNLYSGGIAFGVGFPTTVGAFQTTFAAITDIALIKYNTSTTGAAARVWATYLGGGSADFPHSLVVNSQGELLLLGSTSSSNYPTTAGALQRTFAGGIATAPLGYPAPYDCPNGSDMVITRLTATGSALVGSTYLGGSGNDGLLPLNVNNSPFSSAPQLPHNYGDPFRGDILVDAADNVYIASHTTSSNFPMARGFRSVYHGGTSDGVVCKLTPTLTALTWGSYLGGSGADAAYSIQLEATTGDVYVAGGTSSANFPVTAGAYRTTRPGDIDGFVARISTTGTSLLRATYVGTPSYDQAFFLQLGTDGGVYLLGQTLGNFPVTPGLYNTPNGTQFIQKLDANLGQSLLAMVFGSTSLMNTTNRLISLDPTAFLVDRCDRVYVCGWGGSVNMQAFPYQDFNGSTTGLPITPDAAQSTTDGSDFYLAQFSAGLTGLTYGTYYGNTSLNSGGEHVDGGTSRFDPRGIVYQAVCSCFSTTGFPIPPGANTYSATNNSASVLGAASCNNAAFVLNFQPDVANAGADQAVCATAGPQALTGTPTGGIWTGPGVSGSAATGFVFTPSAALLGVQTLTYTVASTGLCTTTGTRRITVTAAPVVTFAPLAQSTYCTPAAGAPALPRVPLTATPAGGTFSGPGVSGSVATGFTFSPNLPAGTVQITYTLNVGGCVATASQSVVISPLANAGADQAVCATAGPQALTGTPTGGIWTGPGVSGSAAMGFVFTPSAALLGPQTLTYSLSTTGSCSSTRVVTVTAQPTAAFSATLQPTYCLPAPGQPQLLVPLAATPAGGTFSGPGVTGTVATGFVFAPSQLAGTVQIRYAVTVNGCLAQATQNVRLTSPPALTLAPDTVLCFGAAQPFSLRGSPVGGVFSGPGVSGSVATGFVFTPPVGFTGSATVSYTLTDGNCVGNATRRISVAPVPTLVASWTAAACAETRLTPLTLNFALSGSGIPTSPKITWDFGDGSQSAELTPTHTYTSPGTYQPRVRVRYNADRCEAQVVAPTVTVLERKLPNIITPNGDGLNQTFNLGPDCPPHLQVFSRWGRQVFEATTYRNDWSAAGQPDGLYYYLITYPDGHRLKGWVEVVR